jgi:hypothetical protein
VRRNWDFLVRWNAADRVDWVARVLYEERCTVGVVFVDRLVVGVHCGWAKEWL